MHEANAIDVGARSSCKGASQPRSCRSTRIWLLIAVWV